MTIDVNALMQQASMMMLNYGPKILLALITLVIGNWLVNRIGKLIQSSLSKAQFDETLQPYLVGVGVTLLKVILYISVIGMLGVETTSFIAILGAAGLAIGLALQGSLSNFAGGVLILIFKPIRKGDVVEVQGITGTVDSIQPFVTVINSGDRVVNFVPNSSIASGIVKNHTMHNERRVDLTFGIGYGDDLDKAKEVLTNLAKSCPGVHEHLEPKVFVSSLGDNSVNIAVRPFCTPQNYWDVFAYMQEHGKKELDKAGISIPFPQRDVHLYQQQ